MPTGQEVEVFGLIPVIDMLIGDDLRNPSEEAMPRLSADGGPSTVAPAPTGYGHVHVEHGDGHHRRWWPSRWCRRRGGG
ncbi:hypothetical protein ACQP08_08655 [Micromonospora zamorensis]|uniref:hypothetical protein n=1 Tax=Micromonospora zamorensis TaxID=709883 RepID=UPI003D91CC17